MASHISTTLVTWIILEFGAFQGFKKKPQENNCDPLNEGFKKKPQEKIRDPLKGFKKKTQEKNCHLLNEGFKE